MPVPQPPGKPQPISPVPQPPSTPLPPSPVPQPPGTPLPTTVPQPPGHGRQPLVADMSRGGGGAPQPNPMGALLRPQLPPPQRVSLLECCPSAQTYRLLCISP